MKDIWIYRHAESLANAGERTFDVAAIPLSEKGRLQALALAGALTDAPDRIVVSPFLRSAQTAEPSAARFETAQSAVWPIQEFTYLDPVACVGTSWIERKPMIDAYWARLDPDHVGGVGAESFSMLLARARGFLERLAGVEEAISMIISHGQFMQAALVLADHPGIGARDAMALLRERQEERPFANCERLRFVLAEDGLRVAGRG